MEEKPGARSRKKTDLRLSYWILATGFWMPDTALLAEDG
jgi:hypothetical protein